MKILLILKSRNTTTLLILKKSEYDNTNNTKKSEYENTNNTKKPEYENFKAPESTTPDPPKTTDSPKPSETPSTSEDPTKTTNKLVDFLKESKGDLDPMWFVGEMNREESESLLKQKGSNCFLIRYSESNKSHVMTVYRNQLIFHMILQKTEFGWIIFKTKQLQVQAPSVKQFLLETPELKNCVPISLVDRAYVNVAYATEQKKII